LSHEDFVALERSDYQHWALEKAVVDLCCASGIAPVTNKHIDLLVQSGSVSLLFEVKSCAVDEAGKRVRQAIYQLLEYRFLYRHRLGSEVRLCVVAERRPSGTVGWLVSYMEHLGIGIIWRDESTGRLACGEFTKKLLADVLAEVAALPS
jgi:hypothetical protein